MNSTHRKKSVALFVLTLLAAAGYGLILPWGTHSATSWPVWATLWSGQTQAENAFALLFDNRFVCIGLFLFNCILLSHLNLFHLKADTYMPCPMMLIGFSMLPDMAVSTAFMASLTLLLLAVDKWFGSLHEGGQPTTAYVIGLMMGLAGLLYIPTACCMLVFMGGFLWSGSSVARSLASALTGLLTPFLLFQTALFFFLDVPWTFVLNMLEPLWVIPDVAWNTPTWLSVAQGIILLLLAFGAIVSMWNRARNVSTGIWHAWLFTVWMMVFALAAVFVIPSQPAGMYLCSIPFLALLAGNFLPFVFRRRNVVWIFALMAVLSLLTQEEHFLALQGRQTLFELVRHLFQTTPFDFLSCL